MGEKTKIKIMPEKELKFGPSKEERPETSLDRWAEEQALDFIIQKTRARRLSVEDFIQYYGEDTVAEDKAVVKALKQKFEDELQKLSAHERERLRLSQKRGEVLEIIIAEQGELSDWFGPNAMTMRTAEIDDFRNKVDIVIEFSLGEGAAGAGQEAKRIALAIDASDNLLKLADKIRINQEKIMGKRPPAHVQYFRSQVTDFTGPLYRIIPVVVGLDGKNLKDLVRLQNTSLRGGISSGAANEQLAKHPAQRVFIEEIVVQLKWCVAFLKRGAGGRSMYEKKDVEILLGTMEDLLKEKGSIPLGALGDDRVREKIQEMVQ